MLMTLLVFLLSQVNQPVVEQHYTLKPIAMRIPHIRDANGSSTNWSGYAIGLPQKNAATYIRGTWIVPKAIKSTSPSTYSSTWVGIDGYNTSSVEQIGTEQDWSGRNPIYYAWFEMYPQFAFLIDGFPVVPGDSITAEVSYTGTDGNFLLTISNNTRRKSFSTRQKSSVATRQSVEWIQEAPSTTSVLPLANFGVVQFNSCFATLQGRIGPIGFFRYDNITMTTPSKIVKARPSPLVPSGAGFSVSWNHE